MTTERPPLSNPAVLLATWFGVGYLPKAPGTWGSLAALPVAALILALGGQLALLVAAVLLFAAGTWAAGAFMRKTGLKDPGAVVVDEVVGQWLALLPVVKFGLVPFGLAFALFRLLDIRKPWPIGYLDRHIAGGIGVMIDDVAAGLIAAALLWGMLYVLA